MGFSYILTFMAGANTIFAFDAIIVVVSMSSAIPDATFPMTLAVAGAISIMSAFSARATCPTFHASGVAKVSVTTGFFDRVRNVSGLTNSQAFFVMMTSISMSSF